MLAKDGGVSYSLIKNSVATLVVVVVVGGRFLIFFCGNAKSYKLPTSVILARPSIPRGTRGTRPK